MKENAVKLKSIVSSALPKIRKMKDDVTGLKPAETQWSKKEILGHLIDSASNNHQRIVRALYNVADKFPVYDQNEWVRLQNYNTMAWINLVEFWAGYNNHLSAIIEHIPHSARLNSCNMGKDEPVSLEFVVNDYLRHLNHHLAQLI